MDDVKAETLVPILRENIARETHVMTDEAKQYHQLSADFDGHDYVRHLTGEYGRGKIHTNTIEGYFSIFKRGMRGVYQHCGKKHLHRYMAEFDFRYSNRQALGNQRHRARRHRADRHRGQAPDLSNDWCLMAKNQKPESKNQQYQRFLEKVQEMEGAGELSPAEADEGFERAMDRIARQLRPSSDD